MIKKLVKITELLEQLEYIFGCFNLFLKIILVELWDIVI